jgi:hypothetical protein
MHLKGPESFYKFRIPTTFTSILKPEPDFQPNSSYQPLTTLQLLLTTYHLLLHLHSQIIPQEGKMFHPLRRMFVVDFIFYGYLKIEILRLV